MSTRCRIGIENSDGSVDSIYCHFDGSLNYVGLTLKRLYTTVESVRALIEEGNRSSIDKGKSFAELYGEKIFPMKNNPSRSDYREQLQLVSYVYLFDLKDNWLVAMHGDYYNKDFTDFGEF